MVANGSCFKSVFEISTLSMDFSSAERSSKRPLIFHWAEKVSPFLWEKLKFFESNEGSSIALLFVLKVMDSPQFISKL